MTEPASSPTLVRRYLDLLGDGQDAGLRIGDHAVAALAQRFDTPCYFYDAELLRRRYRSVVQALGVDVLFSLKANPSLAVADLLRRAGAGAEVASAGEILIAQQAGFAPAQIQFAGPGKSLAELRLAVAAGVGCVHVESAAEYEILAELARETGSRPGVGIRVNPTGLVSSARIRMSGGGQKFGVDEDMVGALLERILADDVVGFRSLHCYTGTQCFDAEAWLRSCARLLQLAQQLESRHSLRIPAIDLGGGFGVPCFEGDADFDLQAAGVGLRGLLEGQPPRRVYVELGRYLTAPAGIYVCAVRYLKTSAGRRFAVLDGGMHHHGAAAGVGAVIRRPFPIVRVREPLALPVAPVTLGGPLCTPMDCFATEIDFAELRVGDLVAVLCSGAYGLSFSQSAFTGHPAPAEVLVDGDDAALIRAAGRPQDALRGQLLPGQSSAEDG